MKNYLFTFIGVSVLLTFWTFMFYNGYRQMDEANNKIFVKDSIEKENIFHLASIINAECRTCVITEKYMVGSVILNRAEYKNSTILKIIKEENQFKGYLSDNYLVDSTSLEIANNLVKGINRDSSVYYFFSANSSPCWSSNMVIIQKDKFYHKFAY
jgi:spore germination cell wall hydrolase CwlJ-like protein